MPGGEIVPELAQILLNIADRMKTGATTEQDVSAIERIARQAAGEHPEYVIKVHNKPNHRPRDGAAGVERRYQIAKAINDYRLLHKCTLPVAFEKLAPKHHLGPDSLQKIWKEMNGIVKMSDADCRTILFFKKLESRGLAKVTKLGGKKES